MTVRTTCPYCGVGCGVLASQKYGKVQIAGDVAHPANRGRLCSKGSALADTLGPEDRLLYPLIRGERASWNEALTHVADGFSRIVREHGRDAVAFYVSGQLLTEDYYVANKLMKGFIGTANIDTNSRLCMASAVAGHKRAFGAGEQLVELANARDVQAAGLRNGLHVSRLRVRNGERIGSLRSVTRDERGIDVSVLMQMRQQPRKQPHVRARAHRKMQ